VKSVELKLLCELIKNSRKSDRKLAKLVGVSQPTVTRTRTRLEKEGLIEYSGVPNLRKIGFEIIAITFANWKRS
jgi:DNA-binding Lrp family transcriptional regulator